jgi:hypothetical protein
MSTPVPEQAPAAEPRDAVTDMAPTRSWSLLTLVPVAVALTMLGLVLLKHSWWIHPAWDLGIYAIAAEKIRWGAWNPFVPVLGKHIFNDHTDPILWFVAPFTRFFDPAVLLICVEWLSAAGAAFVLHRATLRLKGSLGTATLLSLLYLVNAGTATALYFPAHPGTWSVLPLALMLAWLTEERYVSAAGAFAMLCLCKEEFYPLGLLVGGALAVRRGGTVRPWKGAAAFALVSAATLAYHFLLRPRWLAGNPGGLADHSAGARGVLFSFTSGGLSALWKDPNLLLFLRKMALPLLPLWGWSLWRHRSLNGWALLVGVELVVLRLAYGVNAGFHYGAAVAVCLCFAVVRKESASPPRWLAAVAVLVSLFAFLQGSLAQLSPAVVWNTPVAQFFEIWPHDPRYPPNKQRLEGLQLVADRILADCARTPGRTLFAQPNLVPHITRAACNVRSLHCDDLKAAVARGESVGVAFELKGLGDVWPQRSYRQMVECVLEVLPQERVDVTPSEVAALAWMKTAP